MRWSFWYWSDLLLGNRVELWRFQVYMIKGAGMVALITWYWLNLLTRHPCRVPMGSSLYNKRCAWLRGTSLYRLESLAWQPCRVLIVSSFYDKACACLHWSCWYWSDLLPGNRVELSSIQVYMIKGAGMVALIILAPVTASNSAAFSSMECFEFIR